MALANGAEFAGYRIIRLIGAGGMGEVYLAEHPRLPRQDALKILARDLSSGEFRERFIREADLAAKLFHPSIVSVHDRGDDNGQLWIAMDYVDGPDAAKLLRQRYPAGMPVDELITLIEPVASALDYAHRNGLLHRDVKPANILLAAPEEDGQRVFLADFGISRQLGEVSGLTATNLTLGTVAYCAPEQLMGSQIDGRADQYALGATAFHLLTGSQPYEGTNPVAVISNHLNATIPRISDRRPELAASDPVFAKVLAKQPEDRFSSCREFVAALRQAMQPAADRAPVGQSLAEAAAAPTMAAEVFAAAPTNASPAPDRPTQRGPQPAPADYQDTRSAPPKRSKTPLYIGGVVALTLIALGAFIFSRPSAPQNSPAESAGRSVASRPADPKNTLVIGTKFDQPGLGLRNPDGTMSGFDVEVARFVAQELGYSEEQILWKESPSSLREDLISSGQVNYVVANYTITDRRKEEVEFAGPYLATGQGLLVRANTTDVTGPDSLENNKKLCSVTGSTAAQRIQDRYPGVELQEYDSYPACIEALRSGEVDAVTTDQAMLAGYAAQSPGVFRIAGPVFSEERYGIGLKKGDSELRAKINDALAKMEREGAWKAAFDRNLGLAGIPTPAPPPIER